MGCAEESAGTEGAAEEPEESQAVQSVGKGLVGGVGGMEGVLQWTTYPGKVDSCRGVLPTVVPGTVVIVDCRKIKKGVACVPR